MITLPESLDFEGNYETTVSHFEVLRDAAKRNRRIKNLRFDDLRKISPAAALVLASEVDRWNQRANGRLRANVPSWQPDIRQLLCEMGYFELLSLPRPSFDETSKRTTFLKFIRGDTGAANAGELARQFRIEVEKMVGTSIERQPLFEGLSEAITNVGQHAYLPGAIFSKWWLSASFDSLTKTLCVIFYDQGVGIPATLPTADFFERIKTFFDGWRDSQKIEAAMRGGRTATEKTERGKGLQNFERFASACQYGILSIYSSTGLYRMVWQNGTRIELADEARDFQNSIGGTLIEWQVELI
ncbi:MAG TPA: hypothetical protein VII74_03225 [Chthoniobacterales bacterium]